MKPYVHRHRGVAAGALLAHAQLDLDGCLRGAIGNGKDGQDLVAYGLDHAAIEIYADPLHDCKAAVDRG